MTEAITHTEDTPLVNDTNKIVELLSNLTSIMEKDPDYFWSWHCNLAMAIFDSFSPVVNHDMTHILSNEASAAFLKTLLGLDVTKQYEEKLPRLLNTISPNTILDRSLSGALLKQIKYCLYDLCSYIDTPKLNKMFCECRFLDVLGNNATSVICTITPSDIISEFNLVVKLLINDMDEPVTIEVLLTKFGYKVMTLKKK